MNDAAVILGELQSIRGELRALLSELGIRRTAGKTSRQVRKEKRYKLIKELAAALGAGRPWSIAAEVILVLCGKRPAPAGHERAVKLLQSDDETPRSHEAIYRIINEQ